MSKETEFTTGDKVLVEAVIAQTGLAEEKGIGIRIAPTLAFQWVPPSIVHAIIPDDTVELTKEDGIILSFLANMSDVHASLLGAMEAFQPDLDIESIESIDLHDSLEELQDKLAKSCGTPDTLDLSPFASDKPKVPKVPAKLCGMFATYRPNDIELTVTRGECAYVQHTIPLDVMKYVEKYEQVHEDSGGGAWILNYCRGRIAHGSFCLRIKPDGPVEYFSCETFKAMIAACEGAGK